MTLNKKHIWIVAGIISLILAVYLFTLAIKSCNTIDYVQAGSINIDCINGVKVNFYQSNKNFTQYQGIHYCFETRGKFISEAHSLGGTDDYDGAPLSDFHVKCSDSNVIIWYRNGIDVDTFTIQEINDQLK